jgi:hypothetical protein
MDFIFMLTRDDRTVPDGFALLKHVGDVGLGHIGFKDIGVDLKTLAALAGAIRELGAVSYLEIVSTTPKDARMSAQLAVEIGVDRLLGGTEVAATLEIISGKSIEYYPFPGFPVGHPTDLKGKAADIERHCRQFMAEGCTGADLLAYRALEEDPLEMVYAARKALGRGKLIVAGSIADTRQIAQLADAGADAFTMGTAIFDDTFAGVGADIPTRLQHVMAACQ